MNIQAVTGLPRLQNRVVLFLVVGVLLVALPFLVRSGYAMRVINMIILYSIIAIGLNLIGGYGGQLAMGHACYLGVAAYTSALLTMNLGWHFFPALVAGTLLAGIFGLVTGYLALARVTGDYLMIVTMGISEIVRIVMINWVSLTKGPMGIPQVPPAKLFGHTLVTGTEYYFLFLAALLLTVVVCDRLVKSKFGRALVAIREDEIAAKTMGINNTFYKVVGFGISALFAGLAGGLLAHYARFVGPMQYNLDEGLLYFQMIIIGGLGSIGGSILGAAILVAIPEVFRGIYQYRMLINGLLMVIMMIWRPQGLVGNVGPNHPIMRWRAALIGLLRRLIPQRSSERPARGQK